MRRTKKNVELMFEDLKECLSEDGLSQKKWRRYDKNYKPIFEAKLQEPEIKLPEYSRANMKISVIGCQSRIGTTTFAIHICDYISRHKGKTAYVCAYQDGDLQLEMMKEILEAAERENCFSIGGIDFYSYSANVPPVYNAVVYDCGGISKNAYKKPCENADNVYLIGGTSFSELPSVVTAQEPLYDMNYTLMVNFSSEAECEKYSELLSRNLNRVVPAPYSPKLFNCLDYDYFFDKEFERFADTEIDDETEKKAV